MSRIPKELRPRGVYHKEFTPGLDLPSWFYYDLRAIDSNLHIIHHPYKVLWDNIINEYEGMLDDPRYQIHEEYGFENWGFVLTDRHGAPIPDGAFHIWRLCRPYGWAHIVCIEDKHEKYLKLLLRRLHLQARFTDRHGFKAWSRLNDEEAEESRQKAIEDQEELFTAINEENSWLLKKAADNLSRGDIKPTNPQKETIISAPGISHRSRLVRPLEDEEGGLVLPN